MRICNICVSHRDFCHHVSISWIRPLGSTGTLPLPLPCAQLNFCLCPRDWQSNILDVFSSREVALASHHFLVSTVVCLNVPRVAVAKKKAPFDAKMCSDHTIAMSFAHEFDSWLQQVENCGHFDSTNIDAVDQSLQEAFDHAAQSTLCRTQYQSKRPWISMVTLQIIADRDKARLDGNSFLEQQLAKKVRFSVQQDKA